MTSDPKTDCRAVVRVPNRTPAPLAALAQRTLATLKDVEAGAGTPRPAMVDANGWAWHATIEEAIAAAGGDVATIVPRLGPRICRFCGHGPADRADGLGRGECADEEACQRREIAAGLQPHKAVYAKVYAQFPKGDHDGPRCACGRRVADPIHGLGDFTDWQRPTHGKAIGKVSPRGHKYSVCPDCDEFERLP